MNNQPETIPVGDLQSPYTHTLERLDANTTYEISVSAVTDPNMVGPRSDTITVTTLIQGLFNKSHISQVLCCHHVLHCRLHRVEYCSSI